MSLFCNLYYLCRHSLAADRRRLMATLDQFTTAIEAINQATNEVAAEVARLRDLVTGAGLNAEQEAQVLTSLTEIETKLKAIASTNPV